MNKFDKSIRSYWSNSSEQEMQLLLADILQYANSNSQTLKKELDDFKFDKELLPLPIVLEALSKDTVKWGQFYTDILEDIF